MSDRPLVVTGHGRSGTHWLAHVLGHFVRASHEPQELRGDVVVDCRRVTELSSLRGEYPLMHLVRDGRDVVRSTYEYYSGTRPFRQVCNDWAQAVTACYGLEFVRLEDLLQPRSATQQHRIPRWPDWSQERTEMFWDLCGPQMREYGYGPAPMGDDEERGAA